MEANNNNKSSSNSSSINIREKEEENELLKRRISSHPLYGLLVENHMDCLKVSSILSAEGDQETNYKQQHENFKPSTSMQSPSELDHFMEAYCSVLTKLKEAMKEPHHETLAFISNMHSELREMTSTTNHPPPANSSSGERD